MIFSLCVTFFFNNSKGIKKIEDDLIETSLIFPIFKSQASFTRLIRIQVTDSLLIPSSKKVLFFTEKEKFTTEVCFRHTYTNIEILDNITEVLMKSWRNSGKQQSYSKKLGLWKKSADKKKTNYLQPTVNFSNFLKLTFFFFQTFHVL